MAVVGILVGCGEQSNNRSRSVASATSATSATGPTGATTGATGSAQTIDDAYKLVETEDFAAALTIADELGGSAPAIVGRRIANRIGQRASAAILRGNRGGARRLLRSAGDYPSTRALSSARTLLRDAQQRASSRRSAKRA